MEKEKLSLSKKELKMLIKPLEKYINRLPYNHFNNMNKFLNETSKYVVLKGKIEMMIKETNDETIKRL